MLDIITKSVGKIFGTKQERDIKSYMPLVEAVNEEYAKLHSITNDELRNKTVEFREIIRAELAEVDEDIKSLIKEAEDVADFNRKEALFNEIDELEKTRNEELEQVLKDILPQTFAVVKETARRFTENETLETTALDLDRDLAAKNNKYVTIKGDKAIWHKRWMAGGGEVEWNMIHYDVQLIGGMVLHEGKIAEMATGEGKTLVATLPAYLNGLAGLGVHVVTVNDYLARRDAEWIGPIMEFLQLTIDCVDKYKPHSVERRAAYNCDITYGTNNEFGFDYLRDNMVLSPDELVQRKHHYTMVDEVDSVLVDDARTPLIISGPVSKGTEEQEYDELRPFVERLISAQQKLITKYIAEAKKLFKEGKTGHEEGEAGMAVLRAQHGLPKYRPLIKFLSEEGVKVMMQRTENFYMQEQSKNMHLVDDELYFVIDENNRSVDLTEKGAEFLSQGREDANFFVLPDIATEMQDIESDESLKEDEREMAKQELINDFSVKSKRLHSISQLLKAFTLFTRDEDYVVIDEQVKIVDEQTGRMMEGRRYSDGLHQALEAKENVKIGDITQTYATVTLQNYFRMYHKLAGMTGTAETEAGEFWEIYELDVVVVPTNKPIVRDDKEDLVFKTAREKYNAVIEEIVRLSEAGRPVLVGTTTVDVSELLSRMLRQRGISHNVLNAKQHQREAEVVAEAGKPGKVTIATNMAGRGTDIKISDEVKKAGGLAIIGTERHDSRRVDRQLRGRAGRQGDPGSSQFYVSLEDNLMRLFHSERIAKLMDRMGHKDGEVIQHKMVTKSIERAQKKVEENNFGIRKRLLEYDDVMNIQREAIYKKRKHALFGDRLSVDLHNMFESLTENIVELHKTQGNFDTFRRASLEIVGVDPTIEAADFNEGDIPDLVQRYQDQINEKYQRKDLQIREVLMPFINQVHENEGHRYKRIAIPYTDGSTHPLNISASLEKAVKTEGESLMRDIEKVVSLAIMDAEWKDHLRSMDELKDSVQAASFEQKDPLVIYKMEAYELFEEVVYNINEKVTSYLLKGTLIFQDGQTLEEAHEQRMNMSRMQTSRSGGAGQEQGAAARAAAAGVSRKSAKPQTFKRESKKVGRNDPCPCGSGNKYKHCHGKK